MNSYFLFEKINLHHFSSFTYTFLGMLFGAAFLLIQLSAPAVKAQPELVTNQFSDSAPVRSHSLATYSDGSGESLCFGSDTKFDKEQFFCFNGTNLKRVGDLFNFQDPVVYNGVLYFQGEGGTDGRELWRYDGSTVRQVADVNPGGGSSAPRSLTVYDGVLYFNADGGSDGRELWSYDGTDVTQVADINPGSENSLPQSLTVYGDKLYFAARDGSDGQELWSYDGTSVTQVADINPGSDGSDPADLTVYDGSLYFQADGGTDGYELWSHDGTTVTQIADINAGGSFAPEEFAIYDGALYFQGNGGSDGRELWKYDGSSISQVADISTGSSNPEELTVYNSALYFKAKESSDKELWRYDGSSVGKPRFANNSGRPGEGSSRIGKGEGAPMQKITYNGALYFSAGNEDGRELWSWDGTSTSQIADINTGKGSSEPRDFCVYDGTLYFRATNGSDGQELWSYNGTSVSQVADINSGSEDSYPQSLTVYDGKLYFAARDGNDGSELWSYDGTDVSQVANIHSGSFSSSPSDLTVHNGILYFAARDGDGDRLWSYDGSNVTQVASVEYPSELVVFNNALYFKGFDSNHGQELWKYDGTTANRIEDTRPGTGGSDPSDLTVYDGILYFSANDGGGDGVELWRYNGTSISQVEDIRPGSKDSSPKDLIVFDGRLYFSARNGSNGREPHSYDGSNITNADVFSGKPSGGGILPVVYNDGSGKALYFTATNGVSGLELYRVSANSPLPVELAQFEARQRNETVRLTWQTASEQNNAGFAVERQNETGSFEKIGFVEGGGTTTESQNYRFRDTNIPFADSLVYRLKQIDTDGTTVYSSEVVVQQNPDAGVTLRPLFPNPARLNTTVQYIVPSGEPKPVRLSVYNVLGQRVATITDETQKSGRVERSLDVSGWASGTYFLRLQVGEKMRSRRFTVVR